MKFFYRLFTLLLCVSATLPTLLSAQDTVVRIRTRQGQFVPLQNKAEIQSWLQPRTAQLFVAILANTPDVQGRQLLQEQGYELQQALYEKTWLVYKRPQAAVGSSVHSWLKALLPVTPALKTDSAWLSGYSGSGTVLLAYPPSLQFGEIVSKLAIVGALPDPQTPMPAGYIQVNLSPSALRQVLEWPEILSAGPASGRHMLNHDQRGYSGAALLGAPGFAATDLDGAGVMVGIGDNVSGIHHIDLQDKIVNFNPARPTNHGTHVGGTAGGAGIADPAGMGMAPGTTHLTAFFDLILTKSPELHAAYNLAVTNNSYSAEVARCSTVGKYDIVSMLTDDIALQTPEVLHVFAAGNDGELVCPSAAAPGFSNIPGGFQPAKNILVVGNVHKDMNLFSQSSKGPVADGRLKPEICAFGTSVYSSLGNNSYATATGTSMAAPAVTGAAALLTQRYRQLHSQNPSALLLKTLLAGTADDLGTPGPDYKYGLGMFNFTAARKALEQARFDSVTLPSGPSGSVWTKTVSVHAGQAAFKVTLCWSEPSAALLAPQALLNDFDLTVIDPQGNIVQTLVANPLNPLAAAAPAADRINNIEQVLIPNPTPGNYTLHISRHSQASPLVSAVLVYDLLPDSIRIHTPATGQALAAGRNKFIYWSAPAGTGPYTIDYSTDGGASWNQIGTAVDTQRGMGWNIPAATATQARVRITGAQKQAATGDFLVHVPPVIRLADSQCAGYANLQWSPVPGATGYELLRKMGARMSVIDTLTDTTAQVANLPPGRVEWFAVQPLFGSRSGYRSNGISRHTDSIRNCGFGTGDLALIGLASRTTGRLLTQSALTGNDTVRLRVRNLGPTAMNFRIAYRPAAGSWNTTGPLVNLAGGAETVYELSGLPLANPGSYAYAFAVQNNTTSDPVPVNDTLYATFRQLENLPVDLANGFEEGFESAPRITLMSDSFGLFDAQRWDYERTAGGFGRMRTYIDSTILLSGNRSVSLDADRFTTPATPQSLTATLNLAAYQPQQTEIRCEFRYMVHGEPNHPENTGVDFRGSDTAAWMPLFQVDTNLDSGIRRFSGSLSLSDALLVGGQSLTTSAQLRFRQADTTVIAARDYGTGFTFDGVRIYTLGNDVALIGVEAPGSVVCTPNLTTSPDSLVLLVANGTQNPQYQVPVMYQVDSLPALQYTIPFLGPKDTLRVSVPYPAAARRYGRHTLQAWLTYAPDVYAPNDTLQNYEFYLQPVVIQFPYLEDFEQNEGNWYASGTRSSWGYGTPASQNIRKAASGTKVWKTGLSGGYNQNEKSFLSSPCFDLTGMQRPYLSISLATDLEYCGNDLCDQVYVEYTTDNSNWYRLGLSVEGYNWYDSLHHRAWTTEGHYRWRVATTPLPQVNGILRLRFVMQSDPSVLREGIALDDIHIYDYEGAIYHGPSVAAIALPNGTATPLVFRNSGKMLGKLQAGSSTTGTHTLRSYPQALRQDDYFGLSLFSRSYALQKASDAPDSGWLQLYITDPDFIRFQEQPDCAVCEQVPDAYSLGVLYYEDPDNPTAEDGLMTNNQSGAYTSYPPDDLQFIPYDSGYAVRKRGNQKGEYWFTPPALPAWFPAAGAAVQLYAERISREKALVRFESFIDTAVANYYLVRWTSRDTTADTLEVFAARGITPSALYSREDQPEVAEGDTVYYQVRWLQKDSSRFRTPYKALYWQPTTNFAVFPNPVARTGLKVRFISNLQSDYRVWLTDVSGKILYTVSGKAQSFDTLLELPVTLASGIYFLHAETEGRKMTEKVVSY